MEERQKTEVLKALEALKKASKEVEAIAAGSHDGGLHSPSMKALLALETGSDDLLSGDPHLSTLSLLLSRLKSLSLSLSHRSPAPKGLGLGLLLDLAAGLLRSLLRRPRSPHHQMLSRVAGCICDEIQSWIDRESVGRLVAALRRSGAAPDADDGEDERAALLLALEARAAGGFDFGLQDVLLRGGAFTAVESALADPTAPKPVRDRCAAAVLALVRFNKDVFVGPVLMGPTVGSLVAIASPAALRAVNGLVAAIRSPLIDELLARGELPKLVSLLSSPDLEVRILALEFALEIGYYGRKEAVDAMLAEELIKRLVGLQRSDLGGALIEIDCWEESGGGIQPGVLGKARRGGSRQRRFLEARPFASAVARFAIQVEVGEGLREGEKREAKQAILRRVKEAVTAPAEAATILAEVLWGSTP